MAGGQGYHSLLMWTHMSYWGNPPSTLLSPSVPQMLPPRRSLVPALRASELRLHVLLPVYHRFCATLHNSCTTEGHVELPQCPSFNNREAAFVAKKYAYA